MDVTQLVFLGTCLWTFHLLLVFGYCSLSYNHLCLSFFGHMFSFPLSKYLGEEWLNCILLQICLFKKSNCSEWLYHFTFLLSVYKSSSFFTALPTLSVVRLFNFSHANRYKMVSHCDFYLALTSLLMIVWASYCMLICHLTSCLVKFVQIFVHFFLLDCFPIIEFWKFVVCSG